MLDKDGKRLPDYTIPSDTDIARQPNAEQINYGKRLLNETRRLLPNNTGASMNCNSCHVQQGKKPMGAPYINTVNSFPQFNPRANRVVTLEDRINGCFMRSMNGKPLAKDSAEMQAMIAYMKWLAQDVPHGAKVQIENAWPIDMKLTPNPERGKSLYAAQCAACHGANGEGKKDRAGDIAFPPLWGDESFNIGAGLARTLQGRLHPQQHADGREHPRRLGRGRCAVGPGRGRRGRVLHAHAAPGFRRQGKDWPQGKKPKDARY